MPLAKYSSQSSMKKLDDGIPNTLHERRGHVRYLHWDITVIINYLLNIYGILQTIFAKQMKNITRLHVCVNSQYENKCNFLVPFFNELFTNEILNENTKLNLNRTKQKKKSLKI